MLFKTPVLDAIRLDSLVSPGTSVYFTRQLEMIWPEILRMELPEIEFQKFIPTPVSRIHPGAQTFTQRMYESFGLAQWISNYADDIPMADVGGKEESFKIKPFGIGYQYTFEDILAGQMAAQSGQPGINLNTEKAAACRRASDEFLENVAWLGDESVGIHGLLNYPSIPRVSMTKVWASTSDPEDVLEELTTIIEDHVTRTRGKSRPTDLVLSAPKYGYFSTAKLANSTTTLLQFFLATNPYIKRVRPSYVMDSAGLAGADMMLIYTPDPAIMHLEVPMPFRQFPAQQKNLAYEVITMTKTGGIVCPFPLKLTLVEMA